MKGEGGRGKGKNLVLVNGEAAAGNDVLDRGLHYGDGVFRTLKVAGGKVRWWDEQFRKLAEDCAALAIPCPDKAVLEAEVLRLAGEPDVGVIKIIITRGVGQRGYAIPADAAPRRIVMGFPGTSQENRDVRVRWCELRLSSQPRLAGIKHLNRLENVLARMEWDDPAVAEGLLLDQGGRVIEGTMSNVFLRVGSVIRTPDLSQCGVTGVQRERILERAPGLELRAEVGEISLDELLAADEVWLSNSVIGLWPVRAIGAHAIPLGETARALYALLESDSD